MDDFDDLMSAINGPTTFERILIGYDPKTDKPVAHAIISDNDYALFLNYADTKGLDPGILDCLNLKIDIQKMIKAGIIIPEPLTHLTCVIKSNIKN